MLLFQVKKSPSPHKKYKGTSNAAATAVPAERRLAQRGAVGVIGSRLVLRLFPQGFREAGATADAVLIARKRAADCKSLGLSATR